MWFAEIETVLRDGTPVVVRPIRPEDKDRLREMFGRLSEESRYRRFMGGIAELSEEQLRYLTEVDFVNHLALLLASLGVSARAAGVRTFRACVLEGNFPMRELLENVGIRLHAESPGLLCMEVPVAFDEIPDSPAGRALKALATEALSALPRTRAVSSR